jgi:hypothetical protein
LTSGAAFKVNILCSINRPQSAYAHAMR